MLQVTHSARVRPNMRGGTTRPVLLAGPHRARSPPFCLSGTDESGPHGPLRSCKRPKSYLSRITSIDGKENGVQRVSTRRIEVLAGVFLIEARLPSYGAAQLPGRARTASRSVTSGNSAFTGASQTNKGLPLSPRARQSMSEPQAEEKVKSSAT